MLLGFLGYGAGVDGPEEVFDQVNAKEFGALDDVLSGPVHTKWRVVTLWTTISFVLCMF